MYENNLTDNNNTLTSKKRLPIYFLVGLVLCVGFIYLLFSFLSGGCMPNRETGEEPVKTSEPEPNLDNDPEIVRQETELIKKGYVKSVSGKIVEFDKNNGRLTINTNNDLATGAILHRAAVNRDTKIYQVTMIVPEKLIKGNSISSEMEGTGNDQIIVASDKNILVTDAEIEVIFPDMVLLNEAGELNADIIYVFKETNGE